MMLKVIVYAYMGNIYSSRKIEKALNENINFMWLSGRESIDHNTIARFRSNKLKAVFKDIFKQVVLFLAAAKLVSLKRIYTDGTQNRISSREIRLCLGKFHPNQSRENGKPIRRYVAICTIYR